jgi:hypothetical protein
MVDRGSFRDLSHLSFVDDRVRSFAYTNIKKSLPDDWAPNAWSVICGRGKECYDHGTSNMFSQQLLLLLSFLHLPVYKDPQKQANKKASNQTNVPNVHFYSTLLRTAVGNRRFRILIDLNMEKYKDAKSKIEKSLIVMTIVDAVREGSVIGGFVRMVRHLWSRERLMGICQSPDFTYYCISHTF